jgi:hypothetical protein
LAYTASGALAAQAGIVRWFTKSKARVLSLLMTGTSVGAMIAPVALAHIIGGNPARWRRGWWLVCACSACAALLTLLGVKERPSDLGQVPESEGTPERAAAQVQAPSSVYRTTEDWSYREVLRSATFWLTCVPGVGFSMLLPLINAHGLRHLQDLGHTAAQAALSFSILASAMLAGMLCVAAFGSRIDSRKLWSAGMLVLGLGVVWAFHAAGPVIHIGIEGLNQRMLWAWTGDLGLYGYAVVVGFGFGSATPAAMTTMSNYFGDKPFADIMGFLAVLSTTIGALAAYLAGLAFDRLGSYRIAFYGVALVCFAGCVILAFLKPPVRKVARQLATAGVER